MKKYTAVVPVKKNSSRLPNKNILPFADDNLLVHKIKQLKKVKEMLEINTRVNWDGQWMEKEPVTPNQEFQNVLDFIEEKEKERTYEKKR